MEKIFNYSNAYISANLLIIKIGEGLPTISVMPGIGESMYAGGTMQFATAQLQLEAIDRRVVQQMVADAEAKQYNIVALGAYSSYTRAEILGMLKYAKDVLKSPQIGVLPHSNGGYGLFNNLTEEMAGYIDAVASVSMGPARSTTTALIMAKYKIPNWFIVSNLDTQVNGDLGKVSEDWHNAILAAGGISFLTLYNDTTITNEHSILSAVLENVARWIATGNAASPKMSIPEFLLANKKGKEAVAPTEKYLAAAESPLPSSPIATEPVKTAPTIKAWNISFNAKREIFLEAIWTDGTKTMLNDNTENPFINIYMPITPVGKERTSVTFKDKTSKAIGPVK